MELENIDDSILVEIFKKSNLVKFISLYDLIISIVYLIFIPYYGFAGIFCFIFSYIGFNGAKNLKKFYLLLYTLYLLFQNIIRIGLFVLMVWNPSYFSYSSIPLEIIIINSFFNTINLIFNYIVFSLYNKLKNHNQYFLDLLVDNPQYISTIVNPV